MRLLRSVLLMIFALSGLASCSGETPSPAAMTPAPTWTPTVTSAPTKSSTPSLSIGRTQSPKPTATPKPPTPTPPRPADSNSIALTPKSPSRIDAAGPTLIPTVAPLPTGAGRSPVRIIIPNIDLDAPVKPMRWRVVGDHTEWIVPDNAAGRHIDSAFPGEKGNVVISGHHNIGGSVFAQVSRIGEPGVTLGIGDEIILRDEVGREFVYRITGWRRIPEANASVAVRQENASYLLPTDFPQLTLITCWPADNNTHRVIIQAALTQIRTP